MGGSDEVELGVGGGAGRQGPATGAADRDALVLEIGECEAEAVVVDAEGLAEGGAGEGFSGVGEGEPDGLGEGDLVIVAGVRRDFEVGVRSVVVGDEGEGDGIGFRSEAVFHGEEELVRFSYEVGVGVSEGVEVSGAPEGLAELCAVFFAHVVDEDDGHLEATLQFAQEAQ